MIDSRVFYCCFLFFVFDLFSSDDRFVGIEFSDHVCVFLSFEFGCKEANFSGRLEGFVYFVSNFVEVP